MSWREFCIGNIMKSLMFFTCSVRIKYLYIVPLYVILVVISII